MSRIKIMTNEDAMAYLQSHKDCVVMFAEDDLENQTPVMFIKMAKAECYPIVEKAASIATVLDDFIAQVNLYTEKQDLPVVKNRGRREIIMLRI